MANVLTRPPFLGRLSVNDRASESIVGLLVALGARGTVRLSSEHAADPTDLVLVSLAATLVWGLVDGFLKLLASKGARLRWAHLTAEARNPARVGHDWAEEALDMSFLAHLDDEARHRIRGQVVAEAGKAEPASPRLAGKDWLDAAAVLVIVVLAGIPAIVPFLLPLDVDTAAYVSNGIAVAMLFAFGLAWGPAHGLQPLKAAVALLLLGLVLVALVIGFGG